MLVALTYGPLPVLREELAGVTGIEEAFIFGSWAARHEGVEGPEPQDVDVLVVGTADADDVFEAGERAGQRLHREVNIRSVTAASWRHPQPTDPFLQHVKASPIVAVELEVGT